MKDTRACLTGPGKEGKTPGFPPCPPQPLLTGRRNAHLGKAPAWRPILPAHFCFPISEVGGRAEVGCFVVCLLEPVAAPGLTFKASNVAFQATREVGEHALSREVTKAKMPHWPRQAGNSQQSQGSPPISGTPQPMHAHLATRCPSQGSPESLANSKMAQGHQQGLPQRNTRNCGPTPQAPCSAGLPKEASDRSQVMSRMFLFKRISCTSWCKDG